MSTKNNILNIKKVLKFSVLISFILLVLSYLYYKNKYSAYTGIKERIDLIKFGPFIQPVPCEFVERAVFVSVDKFDGPAGMFQTIIHFYNGFMKIDNRTLTDTMKYGCNQGILEIGKDYSENFFGVSYNPERKLSRLNNEIYRKY